jgi:hypothetical protein
LLIPSALLYSVEGPWTAHRTAVLASVCGKVIRCVPRALKITNTMKLEPYSQCVRT